MLGRTVNSHAVGVLLKTSANLEVHLVLQVPKTVHNGTLVTALVSHAQRMLHAFNVSKIRFVGGVLVEVAWKEHAQVHCSESVKNGTLMQTSIVVHPFALS